MQAQYLLKQDDVAPTLKSLLQQFYKRHHKHCEISSSQMVEHLFRFILTFSFFYDRHWQNDWYWSCLLSCLCRVFVCFIGFRAVSCVQCCLCHRFVRSWLLLRFYLAFIYSMETCINKIYEAQYKKVSLAYICLSFYINIKIIGHRKINP